MERVLLLQRLNPSSRSGLFTRIGVRPTRAPSTWSGGSRRRPRRVPPRPRAARGARHRPRGGGRPLRDARGDDVLATHDGRDGSGATLWTRHARGTARGADRAGPHLRGPDARPSAPTVRQARAAPTKRGPQRGRSARATSGPAGRWSGAVVVDGTLGWAPPRSATAIDRGVRAAGEDHGCGAGSASTWTTTSTSAGSASERAGDLHRGWNWADGRATSIAAWRVRTELADDALTQRIIPRGRGQARSPHPRCEPTSSASRRSGVRAARSSTRGSRGWTLLGTDGPERAGYGICEYLHQLRRQVGPSSPSSSAGRRRAASRRARAVPWGHGARAALAVGRSVKARGSFDLVEPGGATTPLIVQVDRGSRACRRRASRWRPTCSTPRTSPGGAHHAARRGGRIEATGQGWLVVERLDGEVLARRLRRADTWRVARAALAAQCGAALAAIHRIDPDDDPRAATRDPVSDPLGILDALGMVPRAGARR